MTSPLSLHQYSPFHLQSFFITSKTNLYSLPFSIISYIIIVLILFLNHFRICRLWVSKANNTSKKYWSSILCPMEMESRTKAQKLNINFLSNIHMTTEKYGLGNIGKIDLRQTDLIKIRKHKIFQIVRQQSLQKSKVSGGKLLLSKSHNLWRLYLPR